MWFGSVNTDSLFLPNSLCCRGLTGFPPSPLICLAISVDDSGDENGGRLRESLLVIRSRRRSRSPIPCLFPVYDSGEENGGRLGESLLVIRSRRRSRSPIPCLHFVSCLAEANCALKGLDILAQGTALSLIHNSAPLPPCVAGKPAYRPTTSPFRVFWPLPPCVAGEEACTWQGEREAYSPAG